MQIYRMCTTFATAVILYSALLTTSAFSQDASSPFTIGDQLEIHSDILNEQRPLIIGKPSSYESGEESYPVLILLDGDAHFHHTTAVLKFLAANGLIPEMLVVAVPNTDRSRDLTYPSENALEKAQLPTHGGAENFLGFISDELLPWVDQNYRTHPYRILVGHSLGGLFAITTLVTRPEVFNGYIAISPSLQWNNQATVAQAEAFFDATEELQADLYMTAGNEGGTLLGGTRKLSGVLDEKAPAKFRWDFNHLGEESHGSVPLRSTYLGLEAIFSDWDLSLTEAMTMLDASGIDAIDQFKQFYKKSGERLGFEREIPGRLIGNLSFQLIQSNRLDEAAGLLLSDPEANTPPSQLLDMIAFSYAQNDQQEKAKDMYLTSAKTHPGNTNARKLLAEMGVTEEIPDIKIELAPAVLASFVGTYKLQNAATITTYLEDGHLMRSFAGTEAEIIPLSSTSFYRLGDDVIYYFDVNENGSVEGLMVDQGMNGKTLGSKTK